MVRFRLLATDLVTHALHHLAMDLFQKGCEQAAQAANNACLSPQQFANAMNSMGIPMRCNATAVISHNPDHLPRWPGLGATPEGGEFGRLRWLNSMPSEEAWGHVWWSRS